MKLATSIPWVLDFDTESRPLNWAGSDFVFSEITAIGACWTFHTPDRVRSWVLGDVTTEEMLRGFREMYVAADLLTGHYIRKHDLPRLNGMMLEFGFPSLPPKLTLDTYLDLKSRAGVSASQASLGDILGVEAPKVAMGQAAWREANRLTWKGIEKTRKRVVGDVVEHMAILRALEERDWLKSPRLWTPDKRW